jgi:hypothetical protein
MEQGLLDYDGFPIGELHLAAREEAKARGFNLRSTEFRNNRQFFLDLGVPACRIRTVTPHIICSDFHTTYCGIPTDYSLGINLPK